MVVMMAIAIRGCDGSLLWSSWVNIGDGGACLLTYTNCISGLPRGAGHITQEGSGVTLGLTWKMCSSDFSL